VISRDAHGLHGRIAVLCAVLFLPAAGGAAAEEASSRFTLSGFGTLGMVHSSEERADFVAGVFAPKGAGHTRRWSPEVDSRLGVQLVGAVTSRLSATVQMISEQNHDGSYEPRVEWANIKYQFTPKLSLRVGRTALASFLVADFRKVGYANTSVRPPEEVYGIVPISSSDGVDASYRGRVGSFDHTLLVGYGQADARPAEGGPVRARDQLILSDTVEAGPVTFRIAYVKSRLDIDTLQGLFAGFRQFGAQGIALADRYDTNDRRVEFVALGGLYDAGDWFVTAEWGTARLNSALGDRAGWYVSGGYRIGNITPYATYARTRATSNTLDPGLSLSGLPPQSVGIASALNAALNEALAAVPVQQGISAGVRWDFMPNFAGKLQYDHKNLGANSAGTLGNLQPGFQRGGSVNLLSATIDLVW
jgi:predicted porin